MSDRLTGERARGLAPLLTRFALVVTVFAVAGAAAGVLWEWIWTPPQGVVVDHELLLDGNGLRADFSGTALYVLVAALSGLLVGVLVAVLADRYELVTLAAVAVGSALAAWLMLQVGQWLGPPDPTTLAANADDYTRISDDLRVAGTSAFTAFPSGALIGLVVVFIGLSRRPGVRE
jgi:hypothetical protein